MTTIVFTNPLNLWETGLCFVDTLTIKGGVSGSFTSLPLNRTPEVVLSLFYK